MPSTIPPPRPSWHVLLAPLPADVVPTRQPVVSPGMAAATASSPIAGWQQLVLHLSAGTAGLRTVLVVLDADGGVLSASDVVLYRNAPTDNPSESHDSSPGTLLQLSIGGRFEDDGSFHGTRWHSVAVEQDDDPAWESTPSEPSPDDVEGLRSVVAELIRRHPRGSG
jgi:hypothetical protein